MKNIVLSACLILSVGMSTQVNAQSESGAKVRIDYNLVNCLTKMKKNEKKGIFLYRSIADERAEKYETSEAKFEKYRRLVYFL